MSKEDAVRKLIALVNHNRNGSIYKQPLSTITERGIRELALKVAIEDEKEQEEPLVRSGKELPRFAPKFVP
ncbi:MAG: hypothetical protein A3H52_01370 [Candidatus Zambryskibacteria bacterium RIFCSPLOWO2_02_FULL_39_26]|uniref:Uncharacterized protein n=1 Tax=Candidatus Zambryskibacteria bacterium RIFCSPLOWO2_12_FULL_39_23 TaxID=1802776 RepID=A0A1G2UU98_9BACT|nr:MAG: hypothetical protein A2W51_02525 [Candidatus Zambryskibacteria bacterium RIFCSPHIGHO2_02_39_10]OHA99228.1 MAG: hypothetical protein A3E59_00035 [Candidatus Zambryskibacteria bacterium RIFCSPHIGHO2_12_FULL_39_47]OHB10653.1 MAG: hypothetical protein A3H52_01370 [Candidatus Zambryskibacteria bacterium RIFCSPLOWO2_02_FULL_39_26]OHB12956.1 MAG: hypothetical protein A3G99_01640 [Candidatus Zambryskibacteria bacterium RIFCSPLOWO2_12_FULL_39_23]